MSVEVGTKRVAGALEASEVWYHKLKQRDGGPPHEKRGGMYHYPIGQLMRWLLDRERRQIDERLSEIEGRLALIEGGSKEEEAQAQMGVA